MAKVLTAMAKEQTSGNHSLTQSVRTGFISEEESYEKCGNYDVVTRWLWFKLWFLWIPYASCTRWIAVNNVLPLCAIGETYSYPEEAFPKEFRFDASRT